MCQLQHFAIANQINSGVADIQKMQFLAVYRSSNQSGTGLQRRAVFIFQPTHQRVDFFCFCAKKIQITVGTMPPHDAIIIIKQGLRCTGAGLLSAAQAAHTVAEYTEKLGAFFHQKLRIAGNGHTVLLTLTPTNHR